MTTEISDTPEPDGAGTPLIRAVAEIEAHVHAGGWDQRPLLFALVHSADFVRDEPETAAQLGVQAQGGDALTPIEQEALPGGELDEALARIAWPDSVAGCALTQEIVVLPPSASGELPDDENAAAEIAAAHPDRREARLAVAVLRDGSSAALLRLRAVDGVVDDIVTAPDLAPNLVDALLTTLAPD